MKDQTEDLTPDDSAVATVGDDPSGDMDLLTLCEIWRALDFATPCHGDYERGEEVR